VNHFGLAKFVGVLCILGLALAACSGAPADPDEDGGAGAGEAEATSQPEPQQPTATPEPTAFAYTGPDPAPGTGNLYGRVLWNSLPAVGVMVEICEDIDYFDGCIGEQYSTTTDEEGMFLFADVTPMDYGLEYEALESTGWVYITSGLFDAADFEVRADEVVFAGDFDAVKYNLEAISPADDSQVQEAQPSLAWVAYPEADFYEVTLSPQRGSTLFSGFETEETSLNAGQDLLNCEYSWSVKAYNAGGVQIAETDGLWYFDVAGQSSECLVTGLRPADGSSVSGEGLVLAWDAHELAEYYRVNLYSDDTGESPLDFVQAEGPSYTVTEDLAPGAYSWVVYAHAADGDFFAFSETYRLVIEP
jgi:hypothetical protein